MNDFRLDIPKEILDYARFVHLDYVPPAGRTGGYQEQAGQSRGYGDLIELVAKLTLHHNLASPPHPRIVKMEMACGVGDSYDLLVKVAKEVRGKRTCPRCNEVVRNPTTTKCPRCDGAFPDSWDRTVNIKTSKYRSSEAPELRDDLTLNVKLEELRRPADFYLQCFVHLESAEEAPHMHVVGGCEKGSAVWNHHAERPEEIPNTGGQCGLRIPIVELVPFETLFQSLVHRT